MITWEMADRLIYERGLIPDGPNATYEDKELESLCKRLRELDDESIRIQTVIRERAKK